jgi:hypothetical protein
MLNPKSDSSIFGFQILNSVSRGSVRFSEYLDLIFITTVTFVYYIFYAYLFYLCVNYKKNYTHSQ